MAPKPILEELYKPVQRELAQVRDEVTRLWKEALALVDDRLAFLPGANGKLLRPALCLLAAGASGTADLERMVPLAVAYEILHMAALTHDDIVDKARLRRGAVSLNALWDDRTAVLSGDYLVALSVGLLLRLDSCSLLDETFRAVRKMVEGELRTIGVRGGDFTQEDCLRLAEEKTATYFAATCVAPTHLDGHRWREPLRQYGLALGIAFQLIDDILDIVQDEKTLGKPSCGDIAEGKKTLPLLFLRDALSQPDRDRLLGMIGQVPIDDDRKWVAERLTDTGARARTEQIARNYANEAESALKPLPATPYKDSMLGLIEFNLVRGS